MAGPTFEVLFQGGWTPDSDIEVEIVPGASALNTCAALVGAPLTHDFCAISLSDLLTRGRPSPVVWMPWPTPISSSRCTTRRAAAARSRSLKPSAFSCATAIRRRRSPSSSRAIVPKQRIEFTTLDKMAEADIGMLSTVLIGNSNTFISMV